MCPVSYGVNGFKTTEKIGLLNDNGAWRDAVHGTV